jgi:uncharacterized membrane protein YadS
MIFLPLRMSAASTRAGRVLAGLLLCFSLAAISTAIAAWGGSSVVWALLIGTAIASVRVPSVRWAPGVEFAGKHVLRIGVALLVLQISAAAFHVLSLVKVGALAADVAIVLVVRRLRGPVMGIEKKLALVLAASVAICCDASAAATFEADARGAHPGPRPVRPQTMFAASAAATEPDDGCRRIISLF